MSTKECVAMILAGGRGERLGSLTHFYPKPALHFGGNHRIIDFTLNNCFHSKIQTIGMLSQYLATDLHSYLGTIHNVISQNGDIHMLPPKDMNHPYVGTADAVYQNLEFIERRNPANVFILAGDHIYNMDYRKLLAFHEEKEADVTIASTLVPTNEASRFGMLRASRNGYVLRFEEKPTRPKTNIASMGVYIFRWDALKKHLSADSKYKQSSHDFGSDVIPGMISSGKSVYTYQFEGYWRDPARWTHCGKRI